MIAVVPIPCRPLIKIWGLPRLSQKRLLALHKKIVLACIARKELGIRDEKGLSVRFPADLITCDRDADILIEVGDVDPAARCVRPNARLAEELEGVLKKWFPSARVKALFNAEVL